MKVSVIIPVYNAEEYVEDAVKSALKQKETAEVILIEDGSPDNSIKVCQKLTNHYKKVRLLQHPNKKNLGAGASRNLGIRESKYDFIAFLDADDFFLDNRFDIPKRLFNTINNIDGVYEAIGVYFQNVEAENKWKRLGYNHITTISKKVSPNDLFLYMLCKQSGTFSLDALVVKKSLFEKTGYFFENLKLHQDTAMTFQMAEFGTLYPGKIDKPVAMRRVHDQNRFVADYDKFKTRCLLWENLFNWGLRNKIDRGKLGRLLLNYEYNILKAFINRKISRYNILLIFNKLMKIPFKHPILCFYTIILYAKVKLQ